MSCTSAGLVLRGSSALRSLSQISEFMLNELFMLNLRYMLRTNPPLPLRYSDLYFNAYVPHHLRHYAVDVASRERTCCFWKSNTILLSNPAPTYFVSLNSLLGDQKFLE